jgi:hypothetical protein
MAGVDLPTSVRIKNSASLIRSELRALQRRGHFQEPLPALTSLDALLPVFQGGVVPPFSPELSSLLNDALFTLQPQLHAFLDAHTCAAPLKQFLPTFSARLRDLRAFHPASATHDAILTSSIGNLTQFVTVLESEPVYGDIAQSVGLITYLADDLAPVVSAQNASVKVELGKLRDDVVEVLNVVDMMERCATVAALVDWLFADIGEFVVAWVAAWEAEDDDTKKQCVRDARQDWATLQAIRAAKD